jgi:hypothetical protein
MVQLSILADVSRHNFSFLDICARYSLPDALTKSAEQQQRRRQDHDDVLLHVRHVPATSPGPNGKACHHHQISRYPCACRSQLSNPMYLLNQTLLYQTLLTQSSPNPTQLNPIYLTKSDLTKPNNSVANKLRLCKN